MKEHITTKPADEGDQEVADVHESGNVGKEIANLVVVDTIVDMFVDIAFRAMRPNEAPETTKMEDKYNLLFRQHQKLNDRNIVLIKAN